MPPPRRHGRSPCRIPRSWSTPTPRHRRPGGRCRVHPRDRSSTRFAKHLLSCLHLDARSGKACRLTFGMILALQTTTLITPRVSQNSRYIAALSEGRNQESSGLRFACCGFKTRGLRPRGRVRHPAVCRKYGNSDPVGDPRFAYHYLYDGWVVGSVCTVGNSYPAPVPMRRTEHEPAMLLD